MTIDDYMEAADRPFDPMAFHRAVLTLDRHDAPVLARRLWDDGMVDLAARISSVCRMFNHPTVSILLYDREEERMVDFHRARMKHRKDSGGERLAG